MSAETEQERVARERDDLAMMLHPEWWPQGSFLPLKRRDKTGTGWDTAVLMAWDVDIWLLWEGKTMFEELRGLEAEQVNAEGMAAIAARGWKVD